MAIEAPPLGLYLHLPWCVSKCPYCDFNSHKAPAGEKLVRSRQAYVSAVISDIGLQAPLVRGRAVHSIFLGGGTPSLFTPAEIQRLLDACRQHFELTPDIEVTMEANPGALDRSHFGGYRAAGVNRLSIGAQSFSADMLVRLGRLHTPDDTVRAVRAAQQAGFERINVDVMYGLPQQDIDGAVTDIDAALSLDVAHISHYQLTLEPNTRFHAFPPQLPEDDDIEDMADQTHARMAHAGFARYEISALCKPGEQSRHNLNYWQFGDYLAVGAGAHGKLTLSGTVHRYARPASPRGYLDHLAGDGELDLGQALTESELIFEYMLNALRLSDGFSLDSFAKRTGCAPDLVTGRLDAARERGLLQSDCGEYWRPTALGGRFVNDLQALFLP